MNLGSQESHSVVVRDAEEIFESLSDLQIHHVHFERHVSFGVRHPAQGLLQN